ncbi:unnamed protein product [Cylicostephanus goldi]|uniref:Uncharacterized protein n=1 Tax=Cylicostephanus goldi TaxID=71465 RepID=A0A3P6SNW7_CYLGO|nr:unnamed protein product [Cylicostephanus goldi]
MDRDIRRTIENRTHQMGRLKIKYHQQSRKRK